MKLSGISRYIKAKKCHQDWLISNDHRACSSCTKDGKYSCNGTMVLRYGSPNKELFWGCSHWPECKYTTSFDLEDERNLVEGLGESLGYLVIHSSEFRTDQAWTNVKVRIKEALKKFDLI